MSDKNNFKVFDVYNGALDDMTDSVVRMKYTRGSAESIASKTDNSLSTLRESFLNSQWNKQGILRTFVCLPIDDALKGGIKVSGDNIDDDLAEKIEKAFMFNAMNDLKEMGYWARLFGGAALVTVTPDENKKSTLNEPFVKERKGQDVSFMAIDRWRIGAVQGYDTKHITTLLSSNAVAYYPSSQMANISGNSIDSSRIVTMIGDIAPVITRQRLNGWGLSVLEKVQGDFDNYETASQLIYELMEEGKINVVKVEGLLNSLKGGYFDDIVKVISKTVEMKKHIKTMVIDSKDDFMQTQANLGGFGEVIKMLMLRLCAGLRMPPHKLFGSKLFGGLSDNDGMQDSYNEMIESTIRPKLRPVIQHQLEIIAFAELGIEVNNLNFEFMPLSEVTQKERSEIDEKLYSRFVDMLDRGIITEDELRDKLERNKLL